MASDIKDYDTDGFLLAFDADTPANERRKYVALYPNVDAVIDARLHCTSCQTHMGCAPAVESQMRMHPVMRTTQCKKCFAFYTSGAFKRGEDGSELYCRWCGEGGDVYCCSKCIYVFCRKCISNNLSRSHVDIVEADDNWECFRCQPEIVIPKRALHWAWVNYLEKRKTEILSNNTDDDVVYGQMNFDRSTCCRGAKKRKADRASTSEPHAKKKKSTGKMDSAKKQRTNLSLSRNNNNEKSDKISDDDDDDTDLLRPMTPPISRTTAAATAAAATAAAAPVDIVCCTPDIHDLLEVAADVQPPPPPVNNSGNRVSKTNQRRSALQEQQSGSTKTTTKHVVVGASPAGRPIYHEFNGFLIDLNSAALQQTIRLPDGKLIQVHKKAATVPPQSPAIVESAPPPTTSGLPPALVPLNNVGQKLHVRNLVPGRVRNNATVDRGPSGVPTNVQRMPYAGPLQQLTQQQQQQPARQPPLATIRPVVNTGPRVPGTQVRLYNGTNTSIRLVGNVQQQHLQPRSRLGRPPIRTPNATQQQLHERHLQEQRNLLVQLQQSQPQQSQQQPNLQLAPQIRLYQPGNQQQAYQQPPNQQLANQQPTTNDIARPQQRRRAVEPAAPAPLPTRVVPLNTGLGDQDNRQRHDAPLMMMTTFPKTPVGDARAKIELQIKKTQEICHQIINKLNSFMKSTAYTTASSFSNVKELQVHIGYLNKYAISRFQTLDLDANQDVLELDKCIDAAIKASDKRAKYVEDDNDLQLVEPTIESIDIDESDDEEPASGAAGRAPAAALTPAASSAISLPIATSTPLPQSTSARSLNLDSPTASSTVLDIPAAAAVVTEQTTVNISDDDLDAILDKEQQQLQMRPVVVLDQHMANKLQELLDKSKAPTASASASTSPTPFEVITSSDVLPNVLSSDTLSVTAQPAGTDAEHAKDDEVDTTTSPLIDSANGPAVEADPGERSDGRTDEDEGERTHSETVTDVDMEDGTMNVPNEADEVEGVRTHDEILIDDMLQVGTTNVPNDADDVQSAVADEVESVSTHGETVTEDEIENGTINVPTDADEVEGARTHNDILNKDSLPDGTMNQSNDADDVPCAVDECSDSLPEEVDADSAEHGHNVDERAMEDTALVQPNVANDVVLIDESLPESVEPVIDLSDTEAEMGDETSTAAKTNGCEAMQPTEVDEPSDGPVLVVAQSDVLGTMDSDTVESAPLEVTESETALCTDTDGDIDTIGEQAGTAELPAIEAAHPATVDEPAANRKCNDPDTHTLSDDIVEQIAAAIDEQIEPSAPSAEAAIDASVLDDHLNDTSSIAFDSIEPSVFDNLSDSDAYTNDDAVTSADDVVEPPQPATVAGN